MDLKTLQKEAFANAQNKGFWPPKEAITQEYLDAQFGHHMMMIVGEVSEGYEAWRGGEPTVHFGKKMEPGEISIKPVWILSDPSGKLKPDGLVIELADAVIRIAQLCEVLGLDLEEAIRLKSAYNLTRSHMHGGKKT